MAKLKKRRKRTHRWLSCVFSFNRNKTKEVCFLAFRRFHVRFVDFLKLDSRVHLSRRPPPSGAQRAPHRPVLAAEALQAPPRVVADGLVLAVEGALHYAPSSTDAR